jgi:hypothetical protein
MIMVALALVGVVPLDGSASPDSGPAATAAEPFVPPRSGGELREAAHKALARWARPNDKQADLAAREFLALYDELGRDGKLAPLERAQLRNKVRGRLQDLAQQIQKRVAIERRLARQTGAAPKSVDAATDGTTGVLAQWGGFGAAGLGGPGVGGAGNPGTANDDYGQQLVDLIQQTIAPASWDINGGPGSMYYWRPGRALVVRQTSEVHDQLGDLLDQLGRAGR